MKTKNAPSKPIAKTPTGKKATRLKYVEEKEEYDKNKLKKSMYLKPKPNDIGDALMKAKIGYSNKTRVKPQGKMGGY